MKVKGDFITNSSTSCYVLFGVHLDFDINVIPDKLWEEFFTNKSKFYQPEMLKDPDKENDLIWSVTDFLPGLEAHAFSDFGEIWIGLSPNAMEEDETLRQFKQRILDNLIKWGFDVSIDDIKYMEDAISDN